MSRRTARWVWAVAVLFGALAAADARACPFCSAQGKTLLGEVTQANLILFGELVNARRDPNEFNKGSTDLKIEMVVKDHPILAGRKTITLPRYVPPDPNDATKYLVFCEVYNGKVDPYRGVAVRADSKIASYLKGAIAVREKPLAEQLKYFFRFLNDPDPDIANDAYTEFGNADYKEYRPMAEELPADVVVGWLKDPNTPASRYGLYGSMLGHCGKPEHAAVLRQLLDDPQRRFSSGMDGMLAGYVMLDPKEGWNYLRGILADPKREFLVRYAGLRAVRFFHDYRPDVVPEEKLVEAVTLLLEQSDIADLPIDDLRKWKRWETADKVFALYDRESHQVPIVKRAVLRFALSCPESNKKAAELVKRARAEDPERVRDIEELLELERAAAAENRAAADGGK
ncbi:MAG TPA: hypothetical protein VIL46_11910 [Gemmataceae bacterium]